MSKQRDRGFALTGTMLIIAVLTILGATVFMNTFLDTGMSVNQRSATQAFYLAEAGLQRAIGEFGANSAWAATLGDSSDAFAGSNSLGGGRYVVEVFDDQPQSGYATIRSTGMKEGFLAASFTVEGIVKKGGQPIYPKILDYAAFTCNNLDYTGGGNRLEGDVYSGGNFTMKGGTNQIQGDVYARGNLAVKDNGQVDGNVTANGGITADCRVTPCVTGDATSANDIKGGSKIAGTKNPKTSPAPVENLCAPSKMHEIAITSEMIDDYVDRADTVLNGNQSLSGGTMNYEGIVTLPSGDLHLGGELTLSGNVIFIVENGNVHLSGPGKIASDPPGAQVTFLILNGNLHVHGSIEVDGVVQVGQVDAGGNVTGGNIHIENGATFHINGSAAALNGNFHITEGVDIRRKEPSDPNLRGGDSGDAGVTVLTWSQRSY